MLPSEVVPRHRYARAVIEGALGARRLGWSWERAAAACTSDGLVTARVVRRWALRFSDGMADQQAAHFADGERTAILVTPADRRRPDPQQRDPWARGATTQL
jgi:hypothetical protein